MGETAQVIVTTRLRAKPGREDALIRVLDTLAEAVRRDEPGCLQYVPLRSRHEAALFLVMECYRDDRALTEHANSTHLREALPALMDALESPPELTIFEPVGES